MGTLAVRVVCLGGGGVCRHFIFFLYTFTVLFVFLFFFVAIQACFHLVGVIWRSIYRVGNLAFVFLLWLFFCSDTGLFPPCRRHVLSICREWLLSFLLCYHVQCLTHTSFTLVFGGQSITKCTSDYPIHAGVACHTQTPFSASCIKC